MRMYVFSTNPRLVCIIACTQAGAYKKFGCLDDTMESFLNRNEGFKTPIAVYELSETVYYASGVAHV